MASDNQTPAPKSDSGKPLHKQDAPELEKTMANAEKGAAKKTSATKTPQKIQEGKTGEHKREY